VWSTVAWRVPGCRPRIGLIRVPPAFTVIEVVFVSTHRAETHTHEKKNNSTFLPPPPGRERPLAMVACTSSLGSTIVPCARNRSEAHWYSCKRCINLGRGELGKARKGMPGQSDIGRSTVQNPWCGRREVTFKSVFIFLRLVVSFGPHWSCDYFFASALVLTARFLRNCPGRMRTKKSRLRILLYPGF